MFFLFILQRLITSCGHYNFKSAQIKQYHVIVDSLY